MLGVQTCLGRNELPLGMGILISIGMLGASIVLAVGNSIFHQIFIQEMRRRVPGVNPKTVIGAGATGFRSVVRVKELNGVVDAYSTSIGRVFLMVAALAAVSVFASFFVGWTDLRKKKNSAGPPSPRGQDQSAQV